MGKLICVPLKFAPSQLSAVYGFWQCLNQVVFLPSPVDSFLNFGIYLDKAYFITVKLCVFCQNVCDYHDVFLPVFLLPYSLK